MIERIELRQIIKAAGGVRAFAARIGVHERAVYYWLADSQKMHPLREKQIRDVGKKLKCKTS